MDDQKCHFCIRIVLSLAVCGALIFAVPGWSLDKDGSSTSKQGEPKVERKKSTKKSFPSSGHFTDARDGTSYRTIRIGAQVWMAENLKYKAGNSWCYDNDANNCQKYGRLYDWQAAMNACPGGWHLPTDEEWAALEKNVGGAETAGMKLKSTNGWVGWTSAVENDNGTDAYGFTVLPAGSRGNRSSFCCLGKEGEFWSATEDDEGPAWRRGSYAWKHGFATEYENVRRFAHSKEEEMSVRCIENTQGAYP